MHGKMRYAGIEMSAAHLYDRGVPIETGPSGVISSSFEDDGQWTGDYNYYCIIVIIIHIRV